MDGFLTFLLIIFYIILNIILRNDSKPPPEVPPRRFPLARIQKKKERDLKRFFAEICDIFQLSAGMNFRILSARGLYQTHSVAITLDEATRMMNCWIHFHKPLDFLKKYKINCRGEHKEVQVAFSSPPVSRIPQYNTKLTLEVFAEREALIVLHSYLGHKINENFPDVSRFHLSAGEASFRLKIAPRISAGSIMPYFKRLMRLYEYLDGFTWAQLSFPGILASAAGAREQDLVYGVKILYERYGLTPEIATLFQQILREATLPLARMVASLMGAAAVDYLRELIPAVSGNAPGQPTLVSRYISLLLASGGPGAADLVGELYFLVPGAEGRLGLTEVVARIRTGPGKEAALKILVRDPQVPGFELLLHRCSESGTVEDVADLVNILKRQRLSRHSRELYKLSVRAIQQRLGPIEEGALTLADIDMAGALNFSGEGGKGSLSLEDED